MIVNILRIANDSIVDLQRVALVVFRSNLLSV
jgi:hypothetical protein